MLAPDTPIYIQFPEDQHPRVLHPATVEAADDHRCTAVAAERFLALEVGLEVTVHFQQRRHFTAQAARVKALMHHDRPRFVFEFIGEAGTVESRRCYRVSTALVELTCTLNGRPDCSVEDVSLTGLAVISGEPLQPAEVVDVALTDLRDRSYAGRAEVRSVREIEGGAGGFRYGLHAVHPDHGGGDLQRGLSSLSMALQRRQLRRLAGTG